MKSMNTSNSMIKSFILQQVITHQQSLNIKNFMNNIHQQYLHLTLLKELITMPKIKLLDSSNHSNIYNNKNHYNNKNSSSGISSRDQCPYLREK